MENTNVTSNVNVGTVDNGIVANEPTMANPLLANDNVELQNNNNVGYTNEPNIDDNIKDMFGQMPNGNEIDNLMGTLGAEGSVFGGVDLGHLGEDLDFSDQSIREAVMTNVNMLKEAGLNPQQIQLMVGRQLEMYKEGLAAAQEEELDPAEVRMNLEQNLTSEEKRNIPSLLNWVNTAISPELLTPEVKQTLFTDPIAIKIMNSLYKNMLSGGNNSIQEPRQTSVPRSAIQYTPEVAMGHYQEWMKTQNSLDRDSINAQIDKLRGFIAQERLNDFDELFSVLKR